jgi:hypothetical protein
MFDFGVDAAPLQEPRYRRASALPCQHSKIEICEGHVSTSAVSGEACLDASLGEPETRQTLQKWCLQL